MSLADINFGSRSAEYAYLNSLFTLSASVILYYDYSLTLSREIQFLWPPHNKQGWFTTACLLNRYLPLLGHLPLVITYLFPGIASFCHDFHVYHEGFEVFLQVLANALCLVRVYALYRRSRLVLGLLLGITVVSMIPASLMVVEARHLSGDEYLVAYGIRGCNQVTPTLEGLYAALSWMGGLIFDVSIFSFTIYKAVTIGRGGRLLDVIVRDGTMYFSVLCIVNLGNILMFRYATPLLKNSIATLTNVLSITLTSRLVLNLREQDSALASLPILVGTERLQATSQAVGPIIFRRGTTSDQVGTSTSGMGQSSVAGTNLSRENIHSDEST